jgi:hypothetical protein
MLLANESDIVGIECLNFILMRDFCRRDGKQANFTIESYNKAVCHISENDSAGIGQALHLS